MIKLFGCADVVGYTTTAAQNVSSPRMLYDHRPLKLNADDYERVCRIPKKKVLLIWLFCGHRNVIIHVLLYFHNFLFCLPLFPGCKFQGSAWRVSWPR